MTQGRPASEQGRREKKRPGAEERKMVFAKKKNKGGDKRTKTLRGKKDKKPWGGEGDDCRAGMEKKGPDEKRNPKSRTQGKSAGRSAAKSLKKRGKNGKNVLRRPNGSKGRGRSEETAREDQ